MRSILDFFRASQVSPIALPLAEKLLLLAIVEPGRVDRLTANQSATRQYLIPVLEVIRVVVYLVPSPLDHPVEIHQLVHVLAGQLPRT
jgi:hypothetical protein